MSRDDFEKWVAQYYTDLMAVAYKIVGHEHAEDAVQSALARALETGNYENCHTNPLTWLMQAVKSAASNSRRAGDRKAAAAQDLRLRSRAGRPGEGWVKAKPPAD